MKKSLYLLMIIGLIFLVGALQISNFNEFGTSEKLTFTGDENITRSISLSKNSNISSSSINLSAEYDELVFISSAGAFIDDDIVLYGDYLYFLSFATRQIRRLEMSNLGGGYTEIIDFDDAGGYTEPFGLVRDDSSWWVAFTNPHAIVKYDDSWNEVSHFNISSSLTRQLGGMTSDETSFWVTDEIGNKILRYNKNGTYLETISIPSPFGVTYYEDKLWVVDSWSDVKKYNTNGTFIETINLNTSARIYSITNNGTHFATGDYSLKQWHPKVYVNMSTNPYISISGTEIWSYSGEFNLSNNKTDDFSSTLNTALNGGACDCTGCSLSGDNCTINFTFHSDTTGILEYSNINITWTEPVSPNLTITEPTGEYATTQITYNISATDNYQTDTCLYWVTRGASLEVANTSVTCSSEITGDLYVSSQNTDYVFHFFVNDTSGNSNYSNSSFSTALNATIITPPSGGGGSSTTIISGGADWTMEAGGRQGLFDVNLVIGSSQVRTILFENLGDESRTITLSCENQEGESGCKYVTFENNIINLPLIVDLKTSAEFKMTARDSSDIGSYKFNILAVDENGKEARVSVSLEIKETGFFSKISARTEGGFPYLLIAIIAFIVGMFLSLFILKNSKVKTKPLIAVIISAIASYIAVSVF